MRHEKILRHIIKETQANTFFKTYKLGLKVINENMKWKYVTVKHD